MTTADTTSIDTLLGEHDFTTRQRLTLPAKAASYQTLDSSFPATLVELSKQAFPQGLFKHQVKALQLLEEGGDVCVATPTASGKSFVFEGAAVSLLSRDPKARVLCLYPARALIQDQLGKWQHHLKGLGIEVGIVDGSVDVRDRQAVLQRCRVVLATPDVAHAYLLKNLDQPVVREWMLAVRLLVLDECHVYGGVFGTNMAFFMRRFASVCPSFQLVASTATVGHPEEFLYKLTGRRLPCLTEADEGSPRPERELFWIEGDEPKPFDTSVRLLKLLALRGHGKFIAFADSRIHVETLVAAVHRELAGEDCASASLKVLPYRAGYETEDRRDIQLALAQGSLAGVVSTSALELGLDIGDIDTCVLVGVPPTMKGFWQRLGRAGRRARGTCLILDTTGILDRLPGGLEELLRRPVEDCHLYLDNRFMQYSNALCCAREQAALGRSSVDPRCFDGLPPDFLKMLDNELDPTDPIDDELYDLKQQAMDSPHHAFPVRSGIEKNFTVAENRGQRLGHLSHSQLQREAYPGAVYLYMARHYRVRSVRIKTGEVEVTPERHYRTRPNLVTKVFPDFQRAVLGAHRSGHDFVVETGLQVSEKVLGFDEKRGSSKPVRHDYGVGSLYAQRPLERYFRTTGVCLHTPASSTLTEAQATLLLEAFCQEFSIESRDVGVGRYRSNTGYQDVVPAEGWCVFDATMGSLRLTQKFFDFFPRVVEVAKDLAGSRGDRATAEILAALLAEASSLEPHSPGSVEPAPVKAAVHDDAELELVAPGSRALLRSPAGDREVLVVGHELKLGEVGYVLQNDRPGKFDVSPSLTRSVSMSVVKHGDATWWVPARQVRPLPGESVLVRIRVDSIRKAA